MVAPVGNNTGAPFAHMQGADPYDFDGMELEGLVHVPHSG